MFELTLFLQNSCSSLSVTFELGLASCTQAQISSPLRLSGTPMT